MLLTDRHDLARQASGLWAISAGLAYNTKDDYELLQKGMIIYDALYSWATYLQKVKHNQNPIEHLFIDVFNNFLKEKPSTKKTPEWVKELKEIIQDHVDANLNLTEISKSLDINPSYLSRKFSKHFDNLSFGKYIRKLRIEKAIELLKDSAILLQKLHTKQISLIKVILQQFSSCTPIKIHTDIKERWTFSEIISIVLSYIFMQRQKSLRLISKFLQNHLLVLSD